MNSDAPTLERATERPPVTVIVPVYNGRDTIGECVASLVAQARHDDEVVVVDDGSTDGTSDVLAQFPVRVLRQDNAGPAAARNLGARSARNDVLLFTDADCRPEPDWIDQLGGAFRDPSVDGARGEYLSDQRESAARWTQLEYEQRYLRMRGAPKVDFVDTYSAAYRREPFLRLGGFDESYPTASVEDQEFSFRAAEAGLRLVHVETARVRHRHNRTWKRYARRKFYIGYWKTKALARHPGKAVSDSHTPQRLKLQVALVGALGASVPLAVFSRTARRGALGLGAAFLATTLPDVAPVARRHAGLAVQVLAIEALRAAALGSGLVAGALSGVSAGRSA